MNAYEIRLEILKIAKNIVETNATKQGFTEANLPTTECSYSANDVLKTADELYKFVSAATPIPPMRDKALSR